MTTSTYLQKETILFDMQSHAIQIGRVLNAKVNIIDRSTGFDHVFGYLVQPIENNESYEVFMVYEKDEQGRYGIKLKEWSILHDGKQTTGYRTIGDVFQFIQKKM